MAPADPLDHCAINVALYGKRRQALGDDGAAARRRRPHRAHFAVGPSRLAWDGNALTIRIDEIAVPIPGRLRGTVRVVPTAITRQAFTLERKRQSPLVADRALRAGPGGTRSAASALAGRRLSRHESRRRAAGTGFYRLAMVARRDAGRRRVILYDARRRDGSRIDLAMTFDPQGRIAGVRAAADGRAETHRLAHRHAASAAKTRRTLVRTLEDAPFYARSLVAAKLLGEPVILMHESLSLDRFRMPVVQAMLPFRMPRAWK